MFDELQTYLLQVVPAERAAVLIDLAEAIAAAGITAHTHGITGILALAEDDDKYITLDSIGTLLDTTARDVLRQFGITLVDDEIPTQTLTQLINGVNLIDNYTDPAQLLGIIEDSNDAADTLTEILDLVTDLNWSDTLMVIESVKPILIERLQERLNLQLANQGTEELEYPQRDVTAYQKRLLNYVQYRRDLLVLDALHNGLRLGCELGAIIEPYTNALLPLAPERVAAEILGFALASNTEDGQLRPAIAVVLESLFIDINHITKVDAALQPLLAQVTHAQT